MKKLVMVSALALGMTMSARAAVYAWGMDANANLASYAGDTVYVLASTFAWSDSTTLTDVQGAAVSQGSVADAGRSKYYVPTTTFSDTKDVPSSYDAIFVLVDGDGKYVKWTDTLTGNAATEANPTTLKYGQSDLASFTSAQGGAKAFGGGGEGGGVPEPTSGLLLLVGGAMLALRRKQK